MFHAQQQLMINLSKLTLQIMINVSQQFLITD